MISVFRRCHFAFAAGAVALGLTVAGSDAAAQVLPIQNTPGAGQLRSEFHQEVRRQVTREVQEWVNVWERGRADWLAQFYAEHALLLAAEGAVQGRPAIEQHWRDRLPSLSGVGVDIGEVVVGNSLAAALGRISYRATRPDGTEQTKTEQFLIVFEQQWGRWIIRSHTFSPAPGASLGRSALHANRSPVSPPQKVLLRVVGQGFAGRSATDAAGGAWDVVGGGIGLELGNTLEFRGHAWQEAGGVEGSGREPLRSFGGEVRARLGEFGRVTPNLMVGGTKFTGAGSPDGAVVPVVGGGLDVRMLHGLSVELDARNYLPQRSSSTTEPWFSAPRDQRWMFTGGLRVAVGRQPQWQDPELTPTQTSYLVATRPAIASLMDAWLAALASGGDEALRRVYSPAALLLAPGDRGFRGPEEIGRFWTEQGFEADGAEIQMVDLRVSGDVAVATAWMTGGGADGAAPRATMQQVVTVFERALGEWVIRAQAVTDLERSAGLPARGSVAPR